MKWAAKGFSLIELMVVLAIATVLATLAIPNLTGMVRRHRALEAAQAARAVISEARAIAQRDDRPVQMLVQAGGIVLQPAVISAAAPIDAPRRPVTGYGAGRTIKFGVAQAVEIVFTDGGTPTNALPGTPAAAIKICASTNTYYRDAVSQTPECRAGDLVSRPIQVRFMVSGIRFSVFVGAALANAEVRMDQ